MGWETAQAGNNCPHTPLLVWGRRVRVENMLETVLESYLGVSSDSFNRKKIWLEAESFSNSERAMARVP